MQGEPVNILLVEDNPAHAKLVIRGLTSHKVGNFINHVEDGAAALDYLYHRGDFADAKKFPRPHIVLLDLRLPKVDGLEVLKTIKSDKDLKSIPVVILTTSEADKDIVTAYEHHANAYLAKPVDFEKFMQQMNDLGFFWLAWNVSIKK